VPTGRLEQVPGGLRLQGPGGAWIELVRVPAGPVVSGGRRVRVPTFFVAREPVRLGDYATYLRGLSPVERRARLPLVPAQAEACIAYLERGVSIGPAQLLGELSPAASEAYYAWLGLEVLGPLERARAHEALGVSRHDQRGGRFPRPSGPR
jgi:hypothetical protein